MKYIFIALLAVLVTGCTDAEVAKKALDGAGYTDVQMTGYEVFACSKDDTFHTGFKAKGPTGKPVEGVVCSAWLKGATIRTK
jgi:hypothetical protein